jgi:hypothetical protein
VCRTDARNESSKMVILAKQTLPWPSRTFTPPEW